MSTKAFHISTAKELLAVKDRVRNLINSQHWGEDGRHKEAVLKSVVERFLPEKFRIASGFVVKGTQTRGQHDVSNQLDLIIYDTQFPVLFKEGDFVIITPDAVKGIIEVKSNLENSGLNAVLEKSNNNGKFIYSGKKQKSRIFNGIFSYEGFQGDGVVDRLKNSIQTAGNKIDDDNKVEYLVDHISFNETSFYKRWHQIEEGVQIYDVANKIYSIDDLSFSFFISNLIDSLDSYSVVDNSNMWFPVDKSIRMISEFNF